MNIEKSEFNDAIGGINRINTSLMFAQEAKMELDAFMWSRALDMFYIELVNYMTSEEKKIFKDWSTYILDYISDNRIQVGNIPREIYKILMQHEENLRKIYDRSGLAGRKQDSMTEIYRQ